MAIMVAFASLPFGLKGGEYEIATAAGPVTAHVTESQYSPLVGVSSGSGLQEASPGGDEGRLGRIFEDAATSYTWYDHPFVLRVVFGGDGASLGSIGSSASILRPLPDDTDIDDGPAIAAMRQDFSEVALGALNHLIAVVRRKARLYRVLDLRRDDIEITVRDLDGTLLCEDPLHEALVQQETELAESFDLLGQSPQWYQEMATALREPEPVSLADELMMEAERAYSQRFTRQAITTCHTAVETGVSALLSRQMRRRGLTDSAIYDTLASRALAAKLDVLLQRNTGSSLRRSNWPLWKAFNTLNDLRNDVVHRGKRPSPQEAQFAIETARGLLRWMDVLRSRNR
jgi:hypothetical protein